MIFKVCFLFALSVAWEVSGASFSNVFVQTGPEAASAVEYLKHGTPSYTYEYANPQIDQLKAAPVGLEYLGYGIPCITSACFYPGQTIASVASVAPSANILAYSAPVSNIPVVYTPGQNEPAGYKYSYAVVNQNTEDYKVQSKLSEGGLLREEYAFLQPDGVVREIQYVANDGQGFNAIIKNVIPDEEVKLTDKIIQPAPPCPEAKSGALTDYETHRKDNDGIHAIGKKPEASVKPEARKKKPEEKKEQQEFLIEISLEKFNDDHVKEPNENIPKSNKGELQKQKNENLENPKGQHTHEKVIDELAVLEPHEDQAASTERGLVESDVYVSYNDIIKCIQAAMAKVNTHPSVPRPTSPLTYLVFNKPC